MNATFWFTAGLLTGVMATTVSLPLWRGIASALALRLRAYLIATAGLEARPEREGGSAEEWELLAKSYEFLGRSADATRARARAGVGAPADGASAGVAVTRVSRTGQVASSAGDLHVTSAVITPSSSRKLALVINHEIG